MVSSVSTFGRHPHQNERLVVFSISIIAFSIGRLANDRKKIPRIQSSSPLFHFGVSAETHRERERWRRWWLWDRYTGQPGPDLTSRWPSPSTSATTPPLGASSISHHRRGLPLLLLAMPSLFPVLFLLFVKASEFILLCRFRTIFVFSYFFYAILFPLFALFTSMKSSDIEICSFILLFLSRVSMRTFHPCTVW